MRRIPARATRIGGSLAMLTSATIRIENLISARGGFDTPIKLGFGVIVVEGDAGGVSLESNIINSHASGGDAGNVTREVITTNAHTGPFDVTQYSPPLAPVHITGALGVLLDPRPGNVAGLTAMPTPASDAVRIAFELGKTAEVELSVYDVTGRQVASVFRGRLAAGPNELRWDGRGKDGRLQSGIYFARLSGEDGSSLARIVLMP